MTSLQLIHPTIQQDEIQYTKAKTLLTLLLFFLFIQLGYSALFIANGAFFIPKTLLNYTGIATTLLCLFTLRFSPNIKLPLRILNCVGFILLTGGVYQSGGFASNDLFWYLIMGTAAMLFIDKNDGIIITILSICTITGFYIIDVYQLTTLPCNPFTSSIHYQFANVLIFILILFFLIWALVRRNLHLQRIIKEVQSSQIREAISQDFHDELGNKLASIVHLSKRLKSSKNKNEQQTMLTVIEHESQQVYDNFRDFIWTNDPNSFTVNSLFMYLTDFNQQFFTHTDIHVEGELKEINTQKIPPLVIRHIVPIFKELMTNVYKYSKATQVNWKLTQNNQQLHLIVKDNGIGFDTNKIKKGNGLTNIIKRVTKLQAEYTINSTPNKGTDVMISINFNKKETFND